MPRVFIATIPTPNWGEEKGLSEEEIEAVVAHELSHWKLKHSAKSVVIVGVVICFRSYLFDYLNQTLGLDGVSIIVDVLQTAIILGYLGKFLSRTKEFQADAYATKLGYGKPLKSALIKLGTNSLVFPKSDALFSAWNHSHPTIVERLAAIDLLMRKSD
ncbi:CAAX prenyl protease 1 [Orchesella cincta]|uniref:CAAX prenyl protease 1 n=1 Tax=Orchesella cincta TaxID=48709 RepID=A0A1D2MWQ9_ORCCI|nr:CAAX prenyl protease 1 [Orchesella cincta]